MPRAVAAECCWSMLRHLVQLYDRHVSRTSGLCRITSQLTFTPRAQGIVDDHRVILEASSRQGG